MISTQTLDGLLKRKNVDKLSELGLRPQLGPDLPTLFDWLCQQGLTKTEAIFDRPADGYLPGAEVLGDRVALASSTNRRASRPHTQRELKDLKERFKKFTLKSDPEQLWDAGRNADGTLRILNWERLPVEAMAFYRPFHFPPSNQWGIYLLVGPLLQYHKQLVNQSKHLKLFSPEVLMHLILFEVFNHEFFHHLVEATATILEILLAAKSASQPIYLIYRLKQAANTFGHPHAPLEEALANAYAYNALSFVTRIKAGFKTESVKGYQKAIERYWQCEPAVYREAGHYIRSDYVVGGAHLLAQFLDKPSLADEVPLSVGGGLGDVVD